MFLRSFLFLFLGFELSPGGYNVVYFLYASQCAVQALGRLAFYDPDAMVCLVACCPIYK
jgi:hypothetical protein